MMACAFPVCRKAVPALCPQSTPGRGEKEDDHEADGTGTCS